MKPKFIVCLKTLSSLYNECAIRYTGAGRCGPFLAVIVLIQNPFQSVYLEITCSLAYAFLFG